jgi:hypothetical protein
MAFDPPSIFEAATQIGSVQAYVCSWGWTGNGRPTVKLALLTQLGNENKYYETDQLGSAIAHALLPRDEI